MHYSSSSENYVSSLKNSPSKWKGDENDKYAYKKSSYKYSTSGSGSTNLPQTSAAPAASNIDQLDVLLEDLKNERRISKEKDYGLPSSSYIVREHEKNTSTTTPLLSTKTTKTFEKSPTPYKTNQFYNEYQRNEIINDDSPVIVKNTTKTTLDKQIDDITLPSNILPPPGTKVTTTVRTYTYEIPGGESTTDFGSTINCNVLKRTDEAADMAAYELTQRKLPSNVTQLHSEIYNSSSKNESLPRVSPSSTIYRAEMYSSSSKTDKVVPNKAPVTNIYHSENYTSNQKSDKILPMAPVTNIYHSENYTSSQKSDKILPVAPVTNIYHSENYTSSHKTEKLPVLPSTNLYQSETYSSSSKTEPLPLPANHVYEVREVREITNTRAPQQGPQTLHNTVVYNVSSSPRVPTEPEQLYGRTINKSVTTSVDRGMTPLPAPTHEALSSYHYSSSTTTSNHLRNGPDYSSPQGKPAPFPVERLPIEQTPTKVDDLMQSFENTDIKNSEVDAPLRKREIDTSTASPKQQHVPSVNRAGKEVFYPPGHEMMLTKRKEMSAAQGGGRWAKGSGMYEYEAGAKSSSKSKSGATMVPVCLPLCCAMPCSIM